ALRRRIASFIRAPSGIALNRDSRSRCVWTDCGKKPRRGVSAGEGATTRAVEIRNDGSKVRIGDLHYERNLWDGILKAISQGRVEGRSSLYAGQMRFAFRAVKPALPSERVVWGRAYAPSIRSQSLCFPRRPLA